MVTPDPTQKYEDYKGQILEGSQLKPGYQIKDLAKMCGMPPGALTRYIRNGKLPQAYRLIRQPHSQHKYPWVIPFGPNIARLQSERRSRLAHTTFSHVPHTRIAVKYKTVSGVRYKLCRACVWQRGLAEDQAWHPATEAYFHKQKTGLYSICKACRSQRLLKGRFLA